MTFLCENCTLRRTSVCARLIGADGVNATVAAQRETRTVPAKRYLQTATNAGNEVRIIRKGWAASVSDSPTTGAHVAQLVLPGDVVGAALLPPGITPRTVRTITPVEYCSFDADFIRTLLDEHDWARQLLLDVAYQRASDLQKRLADIASRDAEGRVASFLLDIYLQLETRGLAAEGHCECPLSQQCIADATSLTQVHVNRVLKKLREKNLLRIEKQVLHIPDVESVQRMLR